MPIRPCRKSMLLSSTNDAKERDIAFEKKELDTSIKEVELNGLQEEIRKMHLDYEYDIVHGLHSIPTTFGITNAKKISSICYIIMCVMLYFYWHISYGENILLVRCNVSV